MAVIENFVLKRASGGSGRARDRAQRVEPGGGRLARCPDQTEPRTMAALTLKQRIQNPSLWVLLEGGEDGWSGDLCCGSDKRGYDALA